MTPLGRVPGARVTRYLGSVSLHFIKESWAASRGGEVASFFHEFVMEVGNREESLVCCCCSCSCYTLMFLAFPSAAPPSFPSAAPPSVGVSPLAYCKLCLAERW